MSENSRILWVTPKWPSPPSDGARQASCSLISSLTGLGKSVDLLSFTDKQITATEISQLKNYLSVQHVFNINKNMPLGPCSRLIHAALSFLIKNSLPFTVMPYLSSEIKRRLEAISAQGPWSHLVFDGLHPAAPFLLSEFNKNNFPEKWIYRAHNIEAKLWENVASQASQPLRGFLLGQYRKIASFESKLISKCCAVATVSRNDLENLSCLYQMPVSISIPIGLDFNKYNPPDEQRSEIKLLFIGGLGWKPNKDGLEWILKEVWPHVTAIRNDVYLRIVGKGSNLLKNKYSGLRNIEFMGEVKNLEDLYHSSDASIVPIFTGSGTRVKAIEACKFGRACISTALGVEGLPLKSGISYLQAETKDEWIRIITKTARKDFSSIGLNAYSELKKDFDRITAGRAFLKLLD